MLALRYSAGKVWANYAFAIAGGIVGVFVIGSLWSASALAGGLGGIAAVAIMLLLGCLKRAAKRDPIVVVDDRGITIGLEKFGTIPWSTIRRAEVRGLAWVIGARLVVEYEGQAPKSTFGDKLNWAVQSKQSGAIARVSINLMELTDQPISALKAAINRANPATAS